MSQQGNGQPRPLNLDLDLYCVLKISEQIPWWPVAAVTLQFEQFATYVVVLSWDGMYDSATSKCLMENLCRACIELAAFPAMHGRELLRSMPARRLPNESITLPSCEP